MASWVQELGTYDFEVVHRPGKMHANADRLSRGLCKQCGLIPGLETQEEVTVVSWRLAGGHLFAE